MEIRYLIIYPAVLAVLTCLIIPFIPAARKSAAGLLAVLLNGVLTSIPAVRSLGGESFEVILGGGPVFGDILVGVDPLSAWFIMVINLTCLGGAWYGGHYMKAYLSQSGNLSLHWSVFSLFHISMIWVCSIHHGLAFLVAWEVMSLSAFLLVMFDYTRFDTLNAGINYIVQTHIGVVFLTIAFIWVGVSEGSLGFEAIETFLRKPGALWLFLLFFIGFGIKAGFIPLHTWLPQAHPAAPAHISGVLSGVMVTMGIYGIARIATYLTRDLALVGSGLLALSVLTASYGILSGAIHRDYKRILAFSTIENIGIMGMGMGIALIGKGMGNHSLAFLGFAGALLHVFNHSLYKPLMFFASGNVYQLTHTRNIEHLGGLIRKLPFTGFFFLCGALAVGGLPPFNGFVSKFLLFSGLMEGMSLEGFRFNILMMAGVIGLALVGGISVLSFAKTFSTIFLGTPRIESRPRHNEVFSFGHMPLFTILFLMLLTGLSPSLVFPMMEKVIYVFDAGAKSNHSVIGSGLSTVGLASFLLILIAALLYFVRASLLSKRTIRSSPTWGCGYPAPNARMQYTGKSFSKSLAKLFAYITSEEKKYVEIPPTTVFAPNRTYQSSYAEFFEKKIINRVAKQLLTFMNYFSFIHNGRVQYYILYGFIFMLMLIVATFSDLL